MSYLFRVPVMLHSQETSLPSRDIIADSIEAVLNPFNFQIRRLALMILWASNRSLWCVVKLFARNEKLKEGRRNTMTGTYPSQDATRICQVV